MTRRALTITIYLGMLLIVLGLMVIFLFSTRILIPAKPATEGYYEMRTTPPDPPRRVWHAGQPSQPEHFEITFPNLPNGLFFILAGIVISAGGLFFQKRAR